jgi:hypothetical protein
VQEFLVRSQASGLAVIEVCDIETIFGAGRMGVLSSPAGLRIEVYQSPR